MGRVVWPVEPFLKPKYQETQPFSKICVSLFPGTGSQNEFFPMRPPAAFSNGELKGRSPSKMQGGVWGGGAARPQDDILTTYLHSISRYRGSQNGWSFSISRKAGYIRMVGPSVFPEKEVISEWLVLQYFQIHELYQSDWILKFQYFQMHELYQNG